MCGRLGCGNPLPTGGRGRPATYCSKACKSKVARDKAGPAAASSRAALLQHAALVADAARSFLASVDSDPATAYQALVARTGLLAATIRDAAAVVRDEVRWSGLDEDERGALRIEEEVNASGARIRLSGRAEKEAPSGAVRLAVVSDRVETGASASLLAEPFISDRAESLSAPGPTHPTPVSDRAETAADPDPAPSAPEADGTPAGPDLALRQALTLPTTRFGPATRTDSLAVTFGAGWTMESWDGPAAGGVHQLLHDGVPTGWCAPLPDGWGPAGWIGALLHGEGRTATVLTDDQGRPRIHHDHNEALGAIRQAHTARLPQAPDMMLGLPTGWTSPGLRNLGTPHRSYTLGESMVHLTWPGHPGLQALERHGQLLGWIEEYDITADTWITLVGDRIVGDAADGEPWLSATPTDALTLLRLALAQGLEW